MLAHIALMAMLAQSKTVEIEFKGATDLTLAGELMLPAGKGPFPAVLMMPGSGPTDRDGNQPGLETNVLKQIADHLAKNGIASFRFDKRPVRRYLSSWPLSEPSKLSDYFSFANHIADAEAAYAAMKKAEGVDATHTAILGHSEGGLFASWMAPRVKPTTVVLLATAGNTMESVLRFQIGRNLSAPGVPEELRKAITESNEETMKSIIKTGKLPEKVHPNLAALYNPSALSLLHSYLTIDPTDSLKKYDGPVLVLNGDADIQIRADVDATRLFEALKARDKKAQELAVIPGASHNLKESKGQQDPAFAGPVMPVILDKITEFLKKNLK